MSGRAMLTEEIRKGPRKEESNVAARTDFCVLLYFWDIIIISLNRITKLAI
jgi:hypothetical protein